MSLLEVEQLSKSFGAIRAVDSVSFEARPGEIYGLLGPNGAGKTASIRTPTGWVLQALHQLISFGSGFDAALVPLAVLCVFGVVANLLAARFFRS